jgi:hypothetical protein
VLQQSQLASPLSIDVAFEQLGIDLDSSTDPQIVASVVRDDMFLDDFPGLSGVLEKALHSPEPLRPMLEKIRIALSQMPPVLAFLGAATQRNLLHMGGDKSVLVRCLNHAFILDRLVRRASEDHLLMEQLRAHLINKREQNGIGRGFWKSFYNTAALAGPFMAAKLTTMDNAYDKIDAARRAGSITPFKAIFRKFSLFLNIIEATVADAAKGSFGNALAGLVLAVLPPRKVTVVEPARELEYSLSSRWVALYSSWNLAFITGNLRHLQLLYPKLLVPEVIKPNPNQYIFRRGVALWLSIAFYILALSTKRPDVPVRNARQLARLWGEINQQYAIDLFRCEFRSRFFGSQG